MGKDCTTPSQDGAEIVMAGVKDSLTPSCASPPVLGPSLLFIHCHNTSFAKVQVFNTGFLLSAPGLSWYPRARQFWDLTQYSHLCFPGHRGREHPWVSLDSWEMELDVTSSPWIQGLLLSHILHNSSEGLSGTEPPLLSGDQFPTFPVSLLPSPTPLSWNNFPK